MALRDWTIYYFYIYMYIYINFFFFWETKDFEYQGDIS